ncbi:MAG TPA: ATP-binding protein, partial [Spirochaetia bacterium]|nr:ATP-binding protein [Spirochaetia bacterium]
NLSVNARDAMPSGGTLTFRTANLRREGSLDRAREQVMLSIRDTGIGMSEEVRSHLFEPFFTTKKAGAGTGLGLATVYGIVNQNQGHVEVFSEPGKGTEFRISFPRVPGSVSRDEEDGKGSELPRGRETILVVEDEQAVRSLTCTLLRGWGYSVLEAALPSDAITIAEREGDSIHLLLTDVVMPGMRGSELARHVLPRCRLAAVLFMSGYPDDEGLGLGGRGPRVHFLAKPFTPEALARKVRETLDGA